MANGKQPPLPKTANVPLPPKTNSSSGPVGPEAYAPRGHNSFLAPMHEDVGRVMQNIIDLQTEVTELRRDRMEWERRALLAEGKVNQLKQEMADVKEDFNKEIDNLKLRHDGEVQVVQRELDYFKSRDAIVQTKLHIGANHFLECIQAIDKDKKDTENRILGNIGDKMTELMSEKSEGDQ